MKLYILFQSNLKSTTGKGSNILIGDVPEKEYKVGEVITGVEINKQVYNVEVTEWTNGEGYDIRIHVSNNYEDIQLTSGQFDAIKKLIKTLKKDEHTN